MAFDALVTNAGRLRILTALAGQGAQEFVALRKLTGLSDGNLSAHARRLEAGGLVDIQKAFRAAKPVTSIHLTPAGRAALEGHAKAVMAAVAGPATAAVAVPAGFVEEAPDDWVD